jgi:hypothetical protein
LFSSAGDRLVFGDRPRKSGGRERQAFGQEALGIEDLDFSIEIPPELGSVNDGVYESGMPYLIPHDTLAGEVESLLDADRPDLKRERHMFL